MAKAKATTSNCHAVAGSDEAEVKRVAKQLAAELAPKDAGEFGLDVIDGAADTVDAAATRVQQTVQALLTVPFFGGKLVWLKNATFFADTVTGRSDTVLDAAAKLADVLTAGLPPDVTFLVSAIDIDKRRSFYKTLQKVSQLQLFDRIDSSRGGWEEDAAAMVQQGARERGLQLGDEALTLFTMFCGPNRRQIEAELEKLDLYLGEARREVQPDDVRLLVPLSRAGVVFELGNAIARRNVQRGLELLDQLLTQGESAIGILLASIVPTVRQLVLAKDLLTRHRMKPPRDPFSFMKVINNMPEEQTRHLPRKKDGGVNSYGVAMAAVNAGAFGMEELRDLLEQCLEANLQLVSSQLEAKVVLTQLVIKAATPRRV